MKNLLLLIASFGLCTAHANDSNWIQAGTGLSGEHYLIDVNNVKAVGSTTWFWTKMTNAGKKYDTVVAKNYVDCNNRGRAFVVAQTFYDKKGKDWALPTTYAPSKSKRARRCSAS